VSSDYFLRNIFIEIFKQYKGKPCKLEQEKWQQRIKLLFGHMNFPELFLPEMKGFPFSGRIERKSYGIIWDIFAETDDESEVCGIFAFFPEEQNTSKITPSIKRTLNFWHLISQGRQIYPAFIPLGQNDEIHIHKALENQKVEFELARFRKNYFKRVKSLLSELENKIRLPGELVGKVFSIAGFNARICALNPVSQRVAILFEKPVVFEPTLRQTVVSGYFYLIGLIWFLMFIRALIFKRIPEVKSYYRVMAWFMAFAAFPAGLSIGAWSSLIQDFEKFRIEETQQTLLDTINNIEVGLSSIDKKFLETSRRIFRRKNLSNALKELPHKPERSEQCLNEIKKSFLQDNIKLDGLIALYNGGWCFSDFSPGVTGRGQLAIETGLGTVLTNYLYERNPKKYESEKVPDQFSDKRVSSLASAVKINANKNIGAIPRWIDGVSDFNLDGENFLQYIHSVESEGELAGVVVLLWGWKDMLNRRISNLARLESLKYRKEHGSIPDLGIYFEAKAGPKAFCRIGNKRILNHYAAFPAVDSRKFSDAFSATVLVSSARLSGIKFVARINTGSVRRLVEQERMSAFLFLAGITLLLLFGAAIAEAWIIKPITHFSSALKNLACGESTEIQRSNREDEIGIAQQSLVRMSEWISEREQLMRFVSPDALDIVAEGNLFKAGAGVLQEVTILVSDIRSFTSLTEENPPEEVFNMVNVHLDRMAEIVQQNSGVVDRYVGDAIWAVFYDPHPKGGKKALRAASQMMQAHLQIQRKRSHNNQFLYRIGVGLCRGTVLAGVIGESSVRLDFSVVGEALNLAERLESLSKFSKETGIIFSENLLLCADELEISYKELSGYPEVFEVTGNV
jgi:class 3 adenylate cyclase